MDLPARRSSPSVVVLGTVSVVASIGAVVALAYGGAWASPLIVGIVGGWIAYGQQREGREHAEKLTQIGDELKRRSLVYERRLDAYVLATTAMLRIIEAADAQVLIFDHRKQGLPYKRPTEWLMDSLRTTFREWATQRAVLHLLADDETRQFLDSFDATITWLDMIHPGLVRKDAPDSAISQEALDENLPHLREARARFVRDYEAFRLHARAHLMN